MRTDTYLAGQLTSKGDEMKLTYWVAETLTDAQVYNIRKRTRREAVATRNECLAQNKPDNPSYLRNAFGPVHKVTVEYSDGFDLMLQAMTEDSIYEGIEV